MRLLFISIGTLLMVLISLFKFDSYKIKRKKAILLSFVLTLSGVIGAYLLYFIENGTFGGISFYGSVLLIPILLFPVSFIFKVEYKKLLDFSVPQICIMLASMKTLCYIEGCCSGILLGISDNGKEIYFPSQLIEMVMAIGIMLLMLYLSKRNLFVNLHYPLFFMIYGAIRLVLNFFRAGLKYFVWIIPAGHFWSIISIIIGGLSIIIYYYRQIDNDVR